MAEYMPLLMCGAIAVGFGVAAALWALLQWILGFKF